MNTELFYLTLVAAFTGVLWIPYVLDRFSRWGVHDTLGYPSEPKRQSLWAARLMKAHANAVENLVIFATLVLVAQIAGVSNDGTAGACVLFFWSRVVHALAYAGAVPWLRTLAFVCGFLAQVAIAWELFASV